MVEPVARGKVTIGFYSLRYLSLVAVATIALALVAWIVQDRQLALAAGVMGLYALHLISIRYILDNQRQHTQALQSQSKLLQRLVDPNEPAPEATQQVSLDNGGEPLPTALAESVEVPDPREDRSGDDHPADQSRDSGFGGAGPQSWPPIGLPLSTIDSSPGLAIPQGLHMPDLPAHGVVVSAGSSSKPGSESDGGGEASSEDPSVVTEVPIPRHFALGTVALIRQLLTPPQVARILMEQRRQPDKRFATLAVEMGLLGEAQREELLLAQQEGLFTEEEMRQAREGLHQFRESTGKALSDLD